MSEYCSGMALTSKQSLSSDSGSRHCSRRTTVFRTWLMAITIAAVALRLVIALELARVYPPVTHPSAATDMHTYQTYAGQILDGTYDFGQGFYYQPFYYACFLPAVYAISGRGPLGVIVSQSLLGGGAVWLTGVAFALLFGRRAGLLAAALLALCRTHCFYTAFTLIAVLQSFWLALLMLLTIVACRRTGPWRWAAAGLVLGLGTATRGNLLLLLPMMLALLAWRERHSPRRLALGALLLGVCFYLPLLPFSWVNWKAHGRWTGPSTAAAAVLVLGNTPDSPPGGREPAYGAGPMDYPEISRAWVAQEALSGPGRVTVKRQIAEWIRGQPLAYVELKFRMLLLFWHRMEVPNNVAMQHLGKRLHAPLLYFPGLCDFWLLGGLGLAGLLLNVRRCLKRPSLAGALAGVTTYCFSIVLFYILARFRVPVLPWLAGFGGFTLDRLLIWGRPSSWRHQPRWTMVRIAVVALAFLAVAAGFDVYRYGWEARVMRLVRPRGVQLQLPDSVLVKDHGPAAFGGWLAVPLAATACLEKRLAQPAAFQHEQPLTVRLALSSEGASVRICCPDAPGLVSQHDVPAGLQWVEIQLPGKALQDRDSWLQLRLNVTHPAAQSLAVVVDSQRQYARSMLDGAALPGELVLQVRIPYGQPVEP